MDVQGLINIRKQAEEAVKAMPDGDLKTKAFEVILTTLLVGSPKIARTERKAKRRKKITKPSKVVGRARGAQTLLQELAQKGRLAQWKTLPELQQELAKAAYSFKQEELSTPLRRLTRSRVLERERQDRDGKKVWVYRAVSPEGQEE